MTRVARVAWGALALNLAVIVWGAFVRASGSGAGCGQHWPLCNGEVLPHSPRVETLIELTHRVTSGLALVAVAWLLVEVFVRTPRRPSLRRAAVASGILIFTEAAVGAGLVLFRLVAENESMARAIFMGVHLVNTFLLLAALALSAHFASGGAALDLRGRRPAAIAWIVALAMLTIAGASGAVAALGDTLYPSRTIAEALAQDLSPTTHVLIRLRLLHPAFAIAAGLVAVGGARYAARVRPAAGDGRWMLGLELLVLAQFVAGGVNVVLLAPVWLQLVHLALADAVWVIVVLNGARTLSGAATPETLAGIEALRSAPHRA